MCRLRERYEVTYGEGLLARKGYLAGDDARRLEELRAALVDPAVDAIVAARGGYGATRLLPRLDPALVARHPKLLVGFSDVTALHAVWARAGVRSIHGPMVAALGRAPPPLVERWVRAVEGEPAPACDGLETLAPGRATAPLVGGNLAVLCALLGGPHAPSFEGRVVFLEDTGERPYRVDRMLTTLRQAGLGRAAAIAVGQLTDCAPNPDGVEARDVVAERLSDLGVPVVCGVPAGHVDDNRELPLGAPVRVDADAGRLELLEPAVAR